MHLSRHWWCAAHSLSAQLRARLFHLLAISVRVWTSRIGCTSLAWYWWTPTAVSTLLLKLYWTFVPVLRNHHLSLPLTDILHISIYINFHPLYQRFYLRRQVPWVPPRRQTYDLWTGTDTTSTTADTSRNNRWDGKYAGYSNTEYRCVAGCLICRPEGPSPQRINNTGYVEHLILLTGM